MRTMKFRNGILSAGLAGGLALATLGTAGSANAATVVGSGGAAPEGACNTSTVYTQVTSKSNYYQAIGAVYHSINGTSYPNTVTFSNSLTGSVTATVSASLGVDANFAVASVKSSVSASLSVSASYTTSMSVAYTVPAHRTGYAQIGTSKWKVGIRTYKENGNCVQATIGTGTLDAPTSIGWKTWNG